ncbi:iron ABC transporter permease [Endozoicomonas sp. G2_1]|uniref:FecCD family ABC transporter permease n=1 Tax=Endozoicomonas sp. G2_1 TaxID=2821091 RepID=UPI001ADAE9D1|nr:iron ABC transporter permease [Endozoicomonas sp. G2_1]MBO9490198.1 iron ABC transporter permease [Endozoicomonas sp. G2_1]
MSVAKFQTSASKWTLLLALALASVALALTIGAVDISPSELVQCLTSACANQLNDTVIWQVRLPRVLVGLVAGIGLAIAGAILQNTTRNPLADPYLFGIVSGAGLGATIASLDTFGLNQALALPMAAFLGAMLAITLVMTIAKLLNRVEQLLLTGVAVSFMLSSVSQFLLYLGEPFATNRVMFWLMGSLGRVTMTNFYVISAVLLTVIIIIVALHRQIDALLLGDESATSLGVNVAKLRLLLLTSCAGLTATIVAYCGGVGFVGLMIPHIARQLVGVTTLPLIFGSALIGGSFLIWVDVAARSLLRDVEIPLGIITSAIGSIFFLYVMLRNRQ